VKEKVSRFRQEWNDMAGTPMCSACHSRRAVGTVVERYHDGSPMFCWPACAECGSEQVRPAQGWMGTEGRGTEFIYGLLVDLKRFFDWEVADWDHAGDPVWQLAFFRAV